MVTLTPDDLPDPGELSQVVCGCTSEAFHFVFDAATVKAVCVKCRAVHASWPRTGQELGLPPRPAPAGPGAIPGVIDPWRDVPFKAGAGWVEPEQEPHELPMVGEAYGGGGPAAEQPPAEEELAAISETMTGKPEGPPPLPAFSPGKCNVLLRGGPYDGKLTAVPPGAVFTVRGYGRWNPTSERDQDGRTVYEFEGN